jgi:glutathionyl-hydroquinone reductase
MVEDWLTYWRAKQELTEDIKNRGSKVTKLDSRGQKQIVNNESIEIMIKMNVQMQKTLEFLGLKPPEMGSERSDQDEEM